MHGACALWRYPASRKLSGGHLIFRTRPARCPARAAGGGADEEVETKPQSERDDDAPFPSFFHFQLDPFPELAVLPRYGGIRDRLERSTVNETRIMMDYDKLFAHLALNVFKAPICPFPFSRPALSPARTAGVHGTYVENRSFGLTVC